jgi:cytochrome c oxidase subunit 2
MPQRRSGYVAVLAAAMAVGAALAAAQQPNERVVRITARQFEYDPPQVTLKRGEAVVLELSSRDRRHGFKVPELGLHAELLPGETVAVRLRPETPGTFVFACDVFCGSGHDDMEGQIVVTE